MGWCLNLLRWQGTRVKTVEHRTGIRPSVNTEYRLYAVPSLTRVQNSLNSQKKRITINGRAVHTKIAPKKSRVLILSNEYLSSEMKEWWEPRKMLLFFSIAFAVLRISALYLTPRDAPLAEEQLVNLTNQIDNLLTVVDDFPSSGGTTTQLSVSSIHFKKSRFPIPIRKDIITLYQNVTLTTVNATISLEVRLSSILQKTCNWPIHNSRLTSAKTVQPPNPTQQRSSISFKQLTFPSLPTCSTRWSIQNPYSRTQTKERFRILNPC